MERPEPYLTGPRRTLLAPWLFSLLLAMVVLGVLIGREGFLTGPVLLTLGLAVAAQGIDALRTGRLISLFPGNGPERADRDYEPVSFWFLTTFFLMFGLVLTLIGGWSLLRAV
jgi:hypothetical protein